MTYNTHKTLEKTEIHHNFLKNTEIRKNTEEWHLWTKTPGFGDKSSKLRSYSDFLIRKITRSQMFHKK